jgi:excisionase family DNA binding protein
MLTIQGKTYITIAEASKLTGYNPGHIQRLATEGKIEAERIGRMWAIAKESVFDYQKTGNSKNYSAQKAKAKVITKIKIRKKAFDLGHKMKPSPDGRVYCLNCQETVENIAKGNLLCQKQ